MQNLQESVGLLAGKRVIVLGDVMLDTFVYGHCNRISPEAPIPVFRVQREDVMLGGAGNVARNIAALGGQAVLIGLAGDDGPGAKLRSKIAEDSRLLADLVADGRPTTQKTRFVAGQQQMLRTDIENTKPADADLLFEAFERQLGGADAVVLSDYAKGVLTPVLLKKVIARARAAGKPVIADPKSVDMSRYDGVSILTPNLGEALAVVGTSGEDDKTVEAAAEALLSRMPGTGAVLITRGPKGMTLLPRDGEVQHFHALARAVFDVSGAGDTVVAAIALSLAATLDFDVATRLSNVAAGMAVSKPGTAVVTAEELARELIEDQVQDSERKIVALDEALQLVAHWRARGETVGFTNGCFDLIHPGHVSQLAQARTTCDHLIVGLNTDASVSRLKGPARPVQNETARAIVLGSLSMVDLVILFGEDTPMKLIEAVRPDVLIKGKDYSVEEVVGSKFVRNYGGRVFLADIAPGHSTTNIISRLTQAG